MRESPDAILDTLIDVAVYILDQADARRHQRGQARAGVPFDTPVSEEEPAFVRAGDVATLLGISERSVYRLAAAGVLPRVKFGKSMRFSRVALLRFIEQQQEGSRRVP